MPAAPIKNKAASRILSQASSISDSIIAHFREPSQMADFFDSIDPDQTFTRAKGRTSLWVIDQPVVAP
jgi:hypothetical protein